MICLSQASSLFSLSLGAYLLYRLSLSWSPRLLYRLSLVEFTQPLSSFLSKSLRFIPSPGRVSSITGHYATCVIRGTNGDQAYSYHLSMLILRLPLLLPARSFREPPYGNSSLSTRRPQTKNGLYPCFTTAPSGELRDLRRRFTRNAQYFESFALQERTTMSQRDSLS